MAATITKSFRLTGQVVATDILAGEFRLRLPSGRTLPARYRPDQEAAILDALRGHRDLQLQLEGSGEFLGDEAEPQRIIGLERLEVRPTTNGGQANGKGKKAVWELVDDVFGDIPPEELEKLPPDGALNHDKYIRKSI